MVAVWLGPCLVHPLKPLAESILFNGPLLPVSSGLRSVRHQSDLARSLEVSRARVTQVLEGLKVSNQSKPAMQLDPYERRGGGRPENGADFEWPI